ncbi:transposase [Mycetohabitans rhizoxinica]|uniref:transposase n=1 Tax=Mycetohabitans rhizoxinica TaxID=412963 RepID=UPI003BAE43CB
MDILSECFLGKYTEQAKLAVVEDYCTGHHGLKVVAQRHGVNVKSLRRWSALYRVHGVNGIQQKCRSNYSVEFKLMVLLDSVKQNGRTCCLMG